MVFKPLEFNIFDSVIKKDPKWTFTNCFVLFQINII